MKKKRKKKQIKDMTTEETMRKLFPKKVVDEAKKQAEEGSKKSKCDMGEE